MKRLRKILQVKEKNWMLSLENLYGEIPPQLSPRVSFWMKVERKAETSEFLSSFKVLFFDSIEPTSNAVVVVVDAKLWFFLLIHSKVLANQCDQMVRLFFNIWPFAAMKISPIMSQICQIKNKLSKICQILVNFCKIWSHWTQPKPKILGCRIDWKRFYFKTCFTERHAGQENTRSLFCK